MNVTAPTTRSFGLSSLILITGCAPFINRAQQSGVDVIAPAERDPAVVNALKNDTAGTYIARLIALEEQNYSRNLDGVLDNKIAYALLINGRAQEEDYGRYARLFPLKSIEPKFIKSRGVARQRGRLERARREGTARAYRTYLFLYPEESKSQAIVDAYQTAFYREVVGLDSYFGYRYYLESMPSSPHREAVNSKLEQFAPQSISRDNSQDNGVMAALRKQYPPIMKEECLRVLSRHIASLPDSYAPEAEVDRMEMEDMVRGMGQLTLPGWSAANSLPMRCREYRFEISTANQEVVQKTASAIAQLLNGKYGLMRRKIDRATIVKLRGDALESAQSYEGIELEEQVIYPELAKEFQNMGGSSADSAREAANRASMAVTALGSDVGDQMLSVTERHLDLLIEFVVDKENPL